MNRSFPFQRAIDVAEPFVTDRDESYAALSTNRWVRQLCISLVVSTVILSRLALPLGAKQVPLVLPVAVVHLLAIAVLTRARLSGPRLLATGGALAVVLFETTLVHRHASMLSLLYVIAIYVPLIVTTPLGQTGLREIWRVFVGLAMVAALAGIVQIGIQAVAGGYYPDPVKLLPESLQLLGYQTTYPAMEGVLPTLKANGMFFVEPSAFSQFLALALLGELWWSRRPLVLALLAGGLVVSFSGTGLLMLAGGLMLGGRLRVMMVAGGFALVAAMGLYLAGYADAFASRIGELQRPGTSGYERFVAPFAAMTLPWEDSVTAVVWGYGAGRVEDLDTEYAANYSPVPKVFLEYGLAGLVWFGAVWWTMFRGLGMPRGVTGGMLVMYFVAAGSLLQPYTVFALWGLTAGFVRASPDRAEDDDRDGVEEE